MVATSVCVCVCVCVCAWQCLTFCDPMNYRPSASPLSMGFSRQECWSGLPVPTPGDLPDPGIEAMSHALAEGFFTTEPPGKLVTRTQHKY